MQWVVRIPWIFFTVAAAIGLLLRWHLLAPVAWWNYKHWLHAHSHMMFLGWVLNALMIGFMSNYSLWAVARYRIIFTLVQVSLLGMLFSFPLQGYGVLSISMSAVHTVLIWIFALWLHRDLKATMHSVSAWLARASMILFMISSLGPLALGPLKANGLGHSPWYYFSVYYYLHFQYNGVFIVGIMSLFFKMLENRKSPFDMAMARRSGKLLLISLFPTYLLSVLWNEPGMLCNVIGLTGAVIQLLALIYFRKAVVTQQWSTSRYTRLLFRIAWVAMLTKTFLQILSAHPAVAALAYEVRPFIIAYIHLVVIGVVTFFLIAWYAENGWLKVFKPEVAFLLFGFIGSESVLVFSGIPVINTLFFPRATVLLLVFSFILIVGIFVLFVRVPCRSGTDTTSVKSTL